MRKSRFRVVTVVTAVLLLIASSASAIDLVQSGQGMEPRLFRSAVDTKGHLTVDGTQVLPHLAISLSLMLDFGFKGWVGPELKNDEEYNRTTIDNYIFSVLMFNLGLADMITIGAQIPIVIPSGSAWAGFDHRIYDSDPLADGHNISTGWSTAGGIGDIAIHTKLRWIRADRHPIGLGTVLQYQIPSGRSELLMGEPGGGAITVKMIADFEPRSWYRGAINIGARYALGLEEENELNSDFDNKLSPYVGDPRYGGTATPDSPLIFKYGPQLTFGFGNSFILVPGVMEAVVEVYGNHLINNFSNRDYLSMEGNVGLKVFVQRSSYLMAGYCHGIPLSGSRGDNVGYGVQSLTHRFFIGFAFEPSIGDSDGDGIKDDVDQCPETPEDMDDFEDSDGCPEEDNDRDGIPDIKDECPLIPEDRDNDADEDGCPERSEGDRDGDGVLDSVDSCPDDPEDLDQFEDANGCPDEDNDNDKIPDVQDVCPNDPEDVDGFEDQNGCPDPDNDNDGIPDVNDQCPVDPETKNGVADEDGCPDEGKVVWIDNNLVIAEKVQFEYDSAKIKPESYDLLDQVAATILGNKQIDKVEVAGHADERGDDEYNLKLTADRAGSVVNYLVRKGVRPEELTSTGYGEYCPLDKGSNEAAWEKNRRVEFKILVIDGTPTGVERGCKRSEEKGVVPGK